MKAILLAGGYATRLQPLTLDQPKPLLPVAGKPIATYLLEKLEKTHHIDEYYIVTNDKFFSHFKKWEETLDIKKPITIVNDTTTSNEDRLGSIGDIQFVIDTYGIQDDVCVLGGDNLFEDDLLWLFTQFEKWGTTIAVHDVQDWELIKDLSDVQLDEDNKIVRFVEKPEIPFSTLCGTLIWVIEKKHLPTIKEVIQLGKQDHAGDFIAHIIDDHVVYGIPLEWEWFDIGTLKQYERANSFYTK